MTITDTLHSKHVLTLFYSRLDVCWLAASEPVKVGDAAIPRQPVASDSTGTDNPLASQSSAACYLSVNVGAVLWRYYWVLRLHCLMPGGKELALRLQWVHIHLRTPLKLFLGMPSFHKPGSSHFHSCCAARVKDTMG